MPNSPQAEERDAARETPGRGLRAIRGRSEFAACDVRPEKHVAMNLVQRHASWNSTNPRVTIVEADITLALALSHNLKTEGYVVESVDRGDEAVRKARRHAARSCHYRLDVAGHVGPRNLYPVAR